MTRYVKATFADGTVLTRSSVTKVYTHAYLVRGWYELSFPYGDHKVGDAVDHTQSGFSGSAEQAKRNMFAETAWVRKGKTPREVTFEEVVPVVEMTAAEYRARNAKGFAKPRSNDDLHDALGDESAKGETPYTD